MDMKKNTIQRSSWVGLFFSLAVIAYAILTLDLSQVFRTFVHLKWNLLFLAFIVYLVNYLLRTWRFRTLLGLEVIPYRNLFGLTSLYGMYLYLLPAKSGEVSYPIMLKKYLDVSLVYSTAILIVVRFFDFFTIVLFLPFVLATFWGQIHAAIRIGALVFCFFIIASSIAGLWVVRNQDWEKSWLHPSESWLGKGKRILGNLLTNLANIDRQGKYLQIALVTIAIWISVQLNFYLIVLALGYPLTIFEIMVVSIIMVPMTLLPLQGFANLGTHEIGWTAAFALLGYSQAVAVSIAVSTHIVLLAFVLVLGMQGWLFLQSGLSGVLKK